MSERDLEFERLLIAVVRGEVQTVRNVLEKATVQMLNQRDKVSSTTSVCVLGILVNH